jgi:hypothetical protein
MSIGAYDSPFLSVAGSSGDRLRADVHRLVPQHFVGDAMLLQRDSDTLEDG